MIFYSQKKESSICDLIKKDHQPLMEMIQKLNHNHTPIRQKRIDYAEFETLLRYHTFAEERSLYAAIKESAVLKEEAFKGDFEHTLCAQLTREIMDIDDDTRWLAKVSVLLDLKKNHIEKEEAVILKKLEKVFSNSELILMGKKYLRYLDEIIDDEKITVSTTVYDPQFHFLY